MLLFAALRVYTIFKYSINKDRSYLGVKVIQPMTPYSSTKTQTANMTDADVLPLASCLFLGERERERERERENK